MAYGLVIYLVAASCSIQARIVVFATFRKLIIGFQLLFLDVTAPIFPVHTFKRQLFEGLVLNTIAHSTFL